MSKVLIADDEKKICHLLSMILEEAGYQVITAGNGAQAFDIVENTGVDMVISDIKMPEMTGIELLQKIQHAQIPCPVVMITAFATISSAVEVMRMGAVDYISKPFDNDQILLTVERALNMSRLLGENKELKNKINRLQKQEQIVYQSEQMRELLILAENVAKSDSAVLIQGESGTGKELFARFIHNRSSRGNRRFVPVNCAAISSSLVESELFGYEKGAYTGAEKRGEGKFEYASKGTIFLDEIGDLPFEAQAKLLRVLQEKKIVRVGGNSEIDTDVRIVCATNKDLLKLVEEKKFREDLYYRINVFPIIPPPLRDKPEDIIPLAQYFWKLYSKGQSLELTGCAVRLLEQYEWPGNVRELANAIERGMILSAGRLPLSADTFSFIVPDNKEQGDKKLFKLPAQGVKLDKVINDLVKQAIEISNDNQSAAARLLGITRAKFRSLVKGNGKS